MSVVEPEPPLALAADFPAADPADWQARVAAVLTRAGTPFDPAAPADALIGIDHDALPIAPLYTGNPYTGNPYAGNPSVLATGWPGAAPFVRGARPAGGAGWDVRARYLDPDPVATNRSVLADLTNGVSSLWLTGVRPGDYATALAGVRLELISVVLDAGAECLDAAGALLALAGDPAGLRGNLGADPIGLAARTGTAVELAVLDAAYALAEPSPDLLPVTVDATVYHDAGATDADELAISLAVAVAYLRALDGAGRGVGDAYAGIEFRYAVTADQFDSIAKLRAARRVWDRVGELSGIAGRPGQRQHAVTSAAMMTRRDPWVNLLRTTIACFSAAVGGAAAVTVSPFDSALGLPEEFGRRIARNTSAILHDESSLARVGDAAGGSYYVETRTAQLAEAAWDRFTELERHGGAVTALESGRLAELLETGWQRRRHELATRMDPVTGVSEFALADEQPLVRPPVPSPASSPVSSQAGGGLPVHRHAEDYERLRDRSDECLAGTGHRPRVVLAALGPVAAHTARVAFAGNLLRAGGIEPLVLTGDAAELATAFARSGARVACLCCSDELYAESAAELAAALRSAGAAQVWIAGRPELAGGGIDRAVHLGCDALAALAALYEASAEPADLPNAEHPDQAAELSREAAE